MIPRFEVIVQIVEGVGSVFYEDGPLYTHSLSKGSEAEEILKGKIYSIIEMISPRDFNIDW